MALKTFSFFTGNVSKQIMQRMLLKKFRPYHSCAAKMKPVRVSTTAKTRDDLVYTYDNDRYQFYQVTDVEDGQLVCTEFNMGEKIFCRHVTLDFGVVGVYEYYGMKTSQTRIHWRQLCGKVFCYKGLLMSIPMNVLCEI